LLATPWSDRANASGVEEAAAHAELRVIEAIRRQTARLAAPFRIHDCRHHFASWFMMRGGSVPALQKILGHASLAMTMQYAHMSPEHLRGEMAKTERSAGVEPNAGTRVGSRDRMRRKW
jgi:integrase